MPCLASTGKSGKSDYINAVLLPVCILASLFMLSYNLFIYIIMLLMKKYDRFYMLTESLIYSYDVN